MTRKIEAWAGLGCSRVPRQGHLHHTFSPARRHGPHTLVKECLLRRGEPAESRLQDGQELTIHWWALWWVGKSERKPLRQTNLASTFTVPFKKQCP